MVIAQLTIFPTDKGSSVGKYVKKAVKAIYDADVKYQHGAMSTSFEAESIDKIFEVVKNARDILSEEGCKRIYINLSVDDRKDKEASMESKLKRISE